MRYVSFGDRGVILNILKNYQALKDSENLDLVETVWVLDNLIDRCMLSKRENDVICCLKNNYTMLEISKLLEIHLSKIYDYLENAIKKIVEFNDFIYFHSLIGKKVV